MLNTSNRWITTAALLGFFSIIALAGRQGTATSSNVLVTNTNGQAVPVKVFAGGVAPMNVNESTHGKDGLQLYAAPDFGIYASTDAIFKAIPGERFVVTNINVAYYSSSNFNLVVAKAFVHTPTHKLTSAVFVPQIVSDGSNAYSMVNAQTLIYLDPGETLDVNCFKTGQVQDYAEVTVSGYRVAYP